MILSRFWYFVLATVAVLGIGTALLASDIVNTQYRQQTVNELIRDRFEVEVLLKLDARARLDTLAGMAAHEDVRTALRQASGRRDGAEIDEGRSERLRTRLRELNGQLDELRGELLFAVDDEGWIVAGIAPREIPDGAGLGQFPLVRRALEGFVRDDVWVFNDEVYRMAARPVVDNGRYVGAIVHGKRFDDDLAEVLSSRLGGASVAFFKQDNTFAGHMPSGVAGAPRREDIRQALETILEDNAESLTEGQRTEPQELPTGGLAVYSLVTGTARSARVGYAIGRPVQQLAGPVDIVDRASGQAWEELPWPFLGGGLVLAFLIAMFLLWLEHDRHLSRLVRATAGLGGSPENRITITDFGGRYRKATQHVNEALDQTAQAAGAGSPRRKAANLDEILGPTAEEQGGAGGGFFGFAEQGSDAGALPEVPPAKPAAPPATPAGAAKPAGAPPAPPKKGPPPPKPPAPGSGAKPPPPKPPPPKPPAPGAKPAAPAAAKAAPAPSAAADSGEASKKSEEAKAEAESDQAEMPTTLQASQPSQRKALKRTLLGVPPPSEEDDEDEDEDEGATMIAQVPQELLEKSASAAEAEKKHFREVFEQFVAMKEKCGEPTKGLTFEKFAVTLRKNRDQIVKRHGASKVRFTVYEKGGKAALKATPIKE